MNSVAIGPLTLYHYDVMIPENVHVLCCHVNFKQESANTCMFYVNFPFSAYFYPHYIIMAKVGPV